MLIETTQRVAEPAKTTHKAGCSRAFGRYDATCPRCAELKAGAPARKGWGSFRREQEARMVAEIRQHRCGPSCGPVCTRFDW